MTAADAAGWGTITALTEQLTAVRVDLAAATAELRATREHLARHEQDDRTQIADHEQRLRSLSRRQWVMTVVVTLMGSGSGGVAGLTAAQLIGW